MHADGMQQIGPYTVTREIGRGGMGVVYLARDSRLDRDVAIKALPEHLANDPDRLPRFQREAKVLASLNHPSIGAIYGIEEVDGQQYLVLEYIDGQTLGEMLSAGPLPIDDAIEIAVKIAEALEVAHEQGVIHRDLKPGNIMVTADGAVKVLDFGLARTTEATSSMLSYEDSPTMTSPMPVHSPTIPGAIMGTAGYMSPEQARGKPVDKRSDIFAFGCMLYEMLTGVRPFHGETVADSIGATLHKEVDQSLLPPHVPANVRRVLHRCLMKNKRDRLHDIADARIELETRIAEEAQAIASAGSRVWPTVAAVLALGLIGSLIWSVRPIEPTPTEQPAVQVTSVRQITDFTGLQHSPSLSADGRTMLYVAEDGGKLNIFRLRVGGSNPINLTADHNGNDFDPAFSPDGERIAFASERDGGGIFIMGATGESPRRVSDVGYAPAWSPDGGSIVYTTDRITGPYGRSGVGQLWVVDLDSGQRRLLDTSGPGDGPDAENTDAVEPAWSPDGKRIAYWRVDAGRRDLFTIAAEGGDRVQLTDDVHTNWNPFWSADSREVFFISDRGGQPGLWSIAVDEDGRPTSEPVAIMPGPSRVWQAAVARDTGQIVILVARSQTSIKRVGFDPQSERFTNEPETIHTSSRSHTWFDVSPDGEWIAFTTVPPEEDIFILRSDGTGLRRLTEDQFKNRAPQWMKDGESLTFYSNRSGNYCIWAVRRDGSNPQIILELEGKDVFTSQWTADEQTLAVTVLSDRLRLGLFDRADDGTLSRRSGTIDNFMNPFSWAPDGQRLLGHAASSTGSLAIAVYNVDTGEITFIRSPGSAHFGAMILSAHPGWIDDHRVIGFDEIHGRIYVYNVVTDETRWLDAHLDGAFYKSELVHGDTLYFVRLNHDADLWLVELETSTGAD